MTQMISPDSPDTFVFQMPHTVRHSVHEVVIVYEPIIDRSHSYSLYVDGTLRAGGDTIPRVRDAQPIDGRRVQRRPNDPEVQGLR